MIFKCGTHELWKCILMADRSNTCLIYRVWSLWNCSFNGGSRRHLPFGSQEIESKSGGEIRVCCFGRPSSVPSKDFCTNVWLKLSSQISLFVCLIDLVFQLKGRLYFCTKNYIARQGYCLFVCLYGSCMAICPLDLKRSREKCGEIRVCCLAPLLQKISEQMYG